MYSSVGPIFFLKKLTLTFSALQANPGAIAIHVSKFGPVLADCLKDGNTPVRLAAERCALHAFQLAKGITFVFSVLLHLNILILV